MTKFRDFLAKQLLDSEFKAEYDALEQDSSMIQAANYAQSKEVFPPIEKVNDQQMEQN